MKKPRDSGDKQLHKVSTYTTCGVESNHVFRFTACTEGLLSNTLGIRLNEFNGEHSVNV